MSLTNFVPHIPFESYKSRFEEHFVMERDNGVIEVRLHTRGGEALWGYELHRALPQMFQAVGQDPDNEVLILTGTGRSWINGRDPDSFGGVREPNYDMWYVDAAKLVESFLWSIDIPAIAVINGPGFHTECALMCDLTIAADDARLFEPHFSIGLVPGDGQFLVYQQLMGLKRASHAMYLREEGITAAEALAWGLVGEILPREKLLPRARDMAQQIMRQPRAVRRLTTQVARRPWRRAVEADFAMHLAHELYGAGEHPRTHDHLKK